MWALRSGRSSRAISWSLESKKIVLLKCQIQVRKSLFVFCFFCEFLAHNNGVKFFLKGHYFVFTRFLWNMDTKKLMIMKIVEKSREKKGTRWNQKAFSEMILLRFKILFPFPLHSILSVIWIKLSSRANTTKAWTIIRIIKAAKSPKSEILLNISGTCYKCSKNNFWLI